MGESDRTENLPPTLLFVDDEPSILSSLRRLFRPLGYKILIAESGAEGLELVAQEHVDLIVSDMRMPEMDGAQFLEKVRALKPEVVRILLTGYADVTSTVNAINKGEIYRYVSKPWDDNDIVLIVRDALARKQLEQENARLVALTQAQNDELKVLNTGLEARVRERTAELEQMNSFVSLANDRLKQNFILTIKVFASLLEMRGGNEAGHARRVADLARKLAKQLGLSPMEQQDVYVAGLLHDIGKIGFPDALLGRPVSKFSGEEIGRYRKHVVAGEEALMPLAELKNAAAIIRSHHERFDGNGFPDGLLGLAIPIGARIVTVANEFDGLQAGTMAEKRFSPEEAKAAIVAGKGKRYDPQVVEAFVELMSNVREELARERQVAAADLKPGMVLARDVVGRDGSLLLATDYVLDALVIRQLQEYSRREGLRVTLFIRNEPRSNT